MIDARELRIGNYLLYRGEKKSKVSSIGSNGFETTYIGKDQPNGSSDLYEYQPIPLTEEWLLRFGFEKMDETWCTHDHYDLERDERGFWLSFQTLQLSEIIYFVHHLQNLHFALTGQELKLNDK